MILHDSTCVGAGPFMGIFTGTSTEFIARIRHLCLRQVERDMALNSH